MIASFESILHLDADGDGSITPLDFEILANKLSTLVGQEDSKRREDYANARKILCQEIMRADANQDGKVTLGELVLIIKADKNNFFFVVFQKNGSIFINIWQKNYINLTLIRKF